VSGPEPSTRWLSCHVDYACRHSGACCRSGWPLPVEDGVVAVIDAAVVSGRLRTVDGERAWLDESALAPDGVRGTLRQAGGGCVFHAADADGHRHCAAHAALGHRALPASCQHFPRVCLIDDRGVRVSLSHYCPTASAMVVDDEQPVTIVDGPPAVSGRAVPEGLDARGELPPRLAERVLTDLDGLTAWEAHVVATLAGPAADPSPERALARVIGEAARLAEWQPGHGSLADAVGQLRAAGAGDDLEPAVRRLADPGRWTSWLDLAAASCVPPWTWRGAPKDLGALDARFVVPAWKTFGGAGRRYLAGRAFGAWLVYQADAGAGLASWLTLCHAVLRVECARACGAAARPLDRDLLIAAIRQADLLLVHYADSLAITRRIVRMLA
jgi:hypothetical protein